MVYRVKVFPEQGAQERWLGENLELVDSEADAEVFYSNEEAAQAAQTAGCTVID